MNDPHRPTEGNDNVTLSYTITMNGKESDAQTVTGFARATTAVESAGQWLGLLRGQFLEGKEQRRVPPLGFATWDEYNATA